jgi:N-acetyl-anhydromuramyl-L-alanine amidase AmpD
MSGIRQHRPRAAWAFAAFAAIAVGMAGPAATLAAGPTGSPLGAAGLASPPHSLLAHVMHVAGPMAPDYPAAVWEPANRNNYTVAARPLTNPVTRIVIHVAEGGWASTYDWFRNASAAASANYVVSSTGRVAQMVHDRDIAWHAGNWAYNETSIGIEHAGFTNVTHFPDAEYRGSARLAAWIADTFLVTPDRTHVIGHSQVPDPNHPGEWGGVDHHTDPGRTWDWPRYMAYLRADAKDTPEQVVDNADPAGVRYDPAVWRVASAQTGRYGRNYLVAAPRSADSPVGFRLAVPAADRYDLMMRWPCGAHSSRAGIRVAATRGTRTTTVDESRGCGKFRYVGSYDLPAGSAWRLEVSSASRARGTIVADAFKLVEESDPSPPTAPVVTVHTGETEIDLGWTRGRDNIAVGGYRAVVDSALAYQGTGRTLAVTGLACDTVHTVSVRAIDMVSNLSPKDLLRVHTGACPAAPLGLTATPQPGAVALAWTAPAAGLSYRVFSNGRLITTTTALGYTVSSLRCATTHTFTVQSVDSSGGASAPASATLTMPAC